MVNMKKQDKIKQLKKEIRWLIESIYESEHHIEMEYKLLKEKYSKSARDGIELNIKNNKNAIKQYLKDKKVFESILKDYQK